MNILFLTAFPPNKKTAGQNYTRQLLLDLADNNIIDLIYWDYPTHVLEIPHNVRILNKFTVNKFSKFNALISGYFPFFAKRYNHKIASYLSSIALNYDLIYFDFSQIMIYAKDIIHPLKIGMCHDVIAQKYSRSRLFSILLGWIKYSEHKILANLDLRFTFSKKDSDYIKFIYGLTTNKVSFYIEKDILKMEESHFEPNEYYIMYGAWNRNENQQSIKWVLAHSKLFDKRIKIIGGGMPKELLNSIKNSNMAIEYVGFIDNPYPVIAASKALIAPLWQGAGVKVKVIEALALGTPVLGTSVTFEGIENIRYNSDKKALLNIETQSSESILAQFSSLNKRDKLQIRNSFLSTYCADKFIEYLAKIR